MSGNILYIYIISKYIHDVQERHHLNHYCFFSVIPLVTHGNPMFNATNGT